MSVLRCALAAALLVAAAESHAGTRTYAPVRADEDWSWLAEEPPETEDAFDPVKNAEISEAWHLTFGGSFRVRFENDFNRALGGPPILSDSHLRARAFMHLEIEHEEDFRWFAEIRAADVFEAERPKSPFFHDDPDLQSFFLEGTIASETLHGVTIRAGRQEMLLGAGRLVAPLDWWGTRRTFEGLRVIARSARTSTSVFGLHPVDHEPHDADTRIEELTFWGAYTTFKPRPGHVIDGYGMMLQDTRENYASESGAKDDLERGTFGVRYAYDGQAGWRAETELAAQGGHVGDDDLSAWAGSGSFGYEWTDARWKPKLLAGFDAASGDDDPTDGDRGTFDPPFPDGHAFLGSMDLVGRSNVKAARLEVSMLPTKGLKWSWAFHRFWLFDEQDALYDANSRIVRRDPTGAAGDDVGMELDMLVAYTFETHHWVAFEVCKWWSGDFVEATGFGDDAWFAWLAYEFKW